MEKGVRNLADKKKIISEIMERIWSLELDTIYLREDIKSYSEKVTSLLQEKNRKRTKQ